MLRALQSFHAGERLVRALEEVHDHDDVIVGREHLFEPVADADSAKSARKPAATKARG